MDPHRHPAFAESTMDGKPTANNHGQHHHREDNQSQTLSTNCEQFSNATQHHKIRIQSRTPNGSPKKPCEAQPQVETPHLGINDLETVTTRNHGMTRSPERYEHSGIYIQCNT